MDVEDAGTVVAVGGTEVFVGLGVLVNVEVEVLVDVGLGVLVNVDVEVLVNVDVGVLVNVDVGVFVNVDVGVLVNVDVGVALGPTAVLVGEATGFVAVGEAPMITLFNKVTPAGLGT